MPVVIALEGTLRFPAAAFAVESLADAWWASLREALPHVLAAVVVPGGFRAVAAVHEPHRAFADVVERAAALGDRIRPGRSVWEPLVAPRRTLDGLLVARWVEEVLRIPCAEGLVEDPLSWRWSTLRDVAGLVCDPWVERQVLVEVMRATGGPGPGWVDSLLGPRPSALGVARRPALARIATASAEATREHPVDIRRAGATRNVFVWLAHATGWGNPELLATLCGTDPPDIERIADTPNPQWLHAAAGCLADPRLDRSALSPCAA